MDRYSFLFKKLQIMETIYKCTPPPPPRHTKFMPSKFLQLAGKKNLIFQSHVLVQ